MKCSYCDSPARFWAPSTLPGRVIQSPLCDAHADLVRLDETVPVRPLSEPFPTGTEPLPDSVAEYIEMRGYVAFPRKLAGERRQQRIEAAARALVAFDPQISESQAIAWAAVCHDPLVMPVAVRATIERETRPTV